MTSALVVAVTEGSAHLLSRESVTECSARLLCPTTDQACAWGMSRRGGAGDQLTLVAEVVSLFAEKLIAHVRPEAEL